MESDQPHPERRSWTVEPVRFEVITVIPYSDEPEYRCHIVDPDELPRFLAQMDDDAHAQRVVNVKEHYIPEEPQS